MNPRHQTNSLLFCLLFSFNQNCNINITWLLSWLYFDYLGMNSVGFFFLLMKCFQLWSWSTPSLHVDLGRVWWLPDYTDQIRDGESLGSSPDDSKAINIFDEKSGNLDRMFQKYVLRMCIICTFFCQLRCYFLHNSKIAMYHGITGPQLWGSQKLSLDCTLCMCERQGKILTLGHSQTAS